MFLEKVSQNHPVSFIRRSACTKSADILLVTGYVLSVVTYHEAANKVA
jgi:hypothetical protein